MFGWLSACVAMGQLFGGELYMFYLTCSECERIEISNNGPQTYYNLLKTRVLLSAITEHLNYDLGTTLSILHNYVI